MNCASCGHTNPAGSRFCSGCGASLAPRCPTCGTETPAGARFCNGCGAAVTARPAADVVSRKIVTIVFADLIGSVSLHERLDAESARRLMDRYHRAMSAAVVVHGGRVVQLLGDGVLAAFGVPRVAEDDAIRGVRAAAGMQRAFRELAREQGAAMEGVGLRVAVNTGEIVVSDDENSVMGDPTNVAARLQQEARDGDVIVGEGTQRLVGELITLAPLGTFALRGRAEAVAAYRVVSLDRPASRQATAFVGREEELRRLTAVYDAAIARPNDSEGQALRAMPAARLAVLLGSPGLGKSRLVAEFTRRAGERATVLAARCDAAGGATFAPLADALRALLRIDEGAGGDVLRAAIDAVVSGDDAERTRIATGIGALLAGTPAPPEETFFVVRRLLAALAAVRPVVLVIDDLQWAEPLLLDLVEHLVQWSSGVPLLVLVAARPELRDARSSLATPGALVSDVVTLGGLDAGAATRLAANVIGGSELPAALAGRVLATSEGNPLFVSELVRMLVQDGTLQRDGDRWITTVEIAKLDMPPTIQVLLAARIERLRPEERSVLERAAVVGRQFSRAAVAHLLRDVADLDARLEALRRSELIESDTGWFLGEPALRFHHVLIRDAAYRRVLKETRAELHARIADWIVARVGDAIEHDETIGWHLEQAHQHLRELGQLDDAGRSLGERAARHLGAAGRRALARDDLPLAASLLGRAIDRLDGADHARADLALDWCEALLAAGDVGPAAAAIDELARFCGDSERLRAWHTCFAGQLAALTDPQALRTTADAVAAAAEQLVALEDAAGEAKAHFVHAMALVRLGKVGACEAALDRALAAARRARDRRRANAVLAGAPVAALWGPSPVTRASGRCLDVVRVLRITQGAPAVEAVALRCQGVLEALRGRTDAARRMVASSRRLVEELGITQRLLESDVFAGHVELIEGDAEAAERWLRTAYEGLRDLGLGIDAAQAAALLGRALLAQGRAAEAEALSHESEALAGDDLKAAIAWRGVRAEALARRGEHVAAIEFARAAVEIAATTDDLLDHADARQALAVALRAAGRGGDADREEARAIELWEAKGATLLVERARQGATQAGSATLADAAGTAPSRPVRGRVAPNAATRYAARFDAAFRSGDAAAVSAAIGDGVTVVHHPTGARFGHEHALGRFAALLRAENPMLEHEPIATLGDALALFRQFTSVDALADDDIAPAGPSRTDVIEVIEAGDGRGSRIEIFAEHHLADALIRLYERYAELQPEGGARDAAATTARAVRVVFGLDPSPSYEEAFSQDQVFVDHRVLGFGSSRGIELLRAGERALREIAADLAMPVEEIFALLPGALLVRSTTTGTERSGGGYFERSVLQIRIFGADGRVDRTEWFDVDREAEALVRFDELTGTRPAVARRPVQPNFATEQTRRLNAAIAARDASALPVLWSDDAVVLHHPTGLTYGRDAAVDGFRAAFTGATGLSAEHVSLATLGASLSLSRLQASATEVASAGHSYGAIELQPLLLMEVNERSQAVRVEMFADDRLADAIARLYERHAELLPEGPERERAATTARAVRVVFALDASPGHGGVVARDYAFVDHRVLGFPSYQGHGGVEQLRASDRALRELADDIAVRVEEIFALQADALLVGSTATGTLREGGGDFERPLLQIRTFDAAGSMNRTEWFDVDDVAAAIARFDELTGERSAAARRVRPNAATAIASRVSAMVAARDVDAIDALFGGVTELVDHPTGAVLGGAAVLATWRVLLRARDPAVEHEALASLGDSLALIRSTMSFSELAEADGDPFGAVRRDELVLIETGADAEQRRIEIFATDHLADAVARLYARYAELLADGPARTRATATARSVGTLLGSPDLDAYRTAFAEHVASDDHRTLGWGSMQGREALMRGFRSLFETSSDIAIRVDDALGLESDAVLMRWTVSGTDRTGGGVFERHFLLMWAFGAGGLVTRSEQFDAECIGEALARFAALAAPPPARRVRPNAASESGKRLRGAALARDLDAIAARIADDFQLLHHPTGATVDREAGLTRWRMLFRAEELQISWESLATLGDSLELGQDDTSFARLTQDELSFGASRSSYFNLCEVNDRGQAVRIEVFSEDHLADAVVRLYERYAELLPDGPDRVRAAATARAIAAMMAPEIDRQAAALAPDVEYEGHGVVAFPPVRGAERLLRGVRTFRELSADGTPRVNDVLGLRSDALLMRRTITGTDRTSGGAYEKQFLALWRFGADGLITRIEQFDPERDAEALARFDALTVPQPPPRRVPANAATAHALRMDAAVAARDLDAFLGLLATGAQAIHHQTGAAYDEREGRRAYEALFRAENLVFAHDPLATLGESLALCRGSLSFSSAEAADLAVGAANMDSLVLMEVDASGLRQRTEFFALDRLSDAVARLYECYAELQADGPERERAAMVARAVAAALPTDIDALAEVLAPDVEFVDRRQLGMGSARGATRYLRGVRSMYDVARDPVARTDDVLAARPDALLVRRTTGGISREGGGAFELHFLVLWVFGVDGRMTRIEMLDADREDEALARFDELTAAARESRFANAAWRAQLEFERNWHARRWEEVVASIGPEFQLEDRRHVVGLDLAGADFLTNLRMMFAMPEGRWQTELLATRGERFILSRVRFSAELAAGAAVAFEHLSVAERNAEGQSVALVLFDPDELEAAHAELDRRYAAGEGAPHAALLAHWQAFRSATNARDWETARNLLPDDFSMYSHRSLASTGMRMDRDTFITSLGWGDERGVRAGLRRDHLPRISARAAVEVVTLQGSVDGGDFEQEFVLVFAHDGRRLRSCEAFDLEQLGAALARFEAHSREPAATARIENAATRAGERLRVAFEALDFEALSALFAPQYRNIDRQRTAQLESERAPYLEAARTMLANFSSCTATTETLATRGERLSLGRIHWRAAGETVGQLEFEWLGILEVDGDGRVATEVDFEPEALDAAYAELDARYAAGEAAPYAGLWETAQRRARARASGDWEQLASLLPADLVTEDHRLIGWGTLRSRDENLAMSRALFDLAPDVVPRLDHVLGFDERGALIVLRWEGSWAGGAFEKPTVIVNVHGPGGSVSCIHLYDLEQLDAARACYAALRTAPAAPRLENAATRARDRIHGAWITRDWDRFVATFAAAFRNVDRRPMMQIEMDRERHLAAYRPMFEMSQSAPSSELLATRGDRLALYRADWEGSDRTFGPSEIGWLGIFEVDDRGQLVTLVMIESDDLDAAYAELDQRYAAGEAVAERRAAVTRAFSRAFAARDWGALAALLAPDLVAHDHRLLGWETLHGPAAYVQALHSIIDLAPDTQLRLDHVSIAAPRFLYVATWVGTRDGGPFEIPSVIVSELDAQGRIVRFDSYDIDRLDEVRAGFAELRPDPLRIPPNAATQTSDRLQRVLGTRDWSGLRALCAPTMRYDDRRRRALLSGDRELFIASNREVLANDPRLVATVLATAGDRLALHHLRWSGATADVGAYENENISLMEIDASGRIVAIVAFDADARRAASLEMFDRYFCGEGARYTPTATIEFIRAANDRDAARARAALPDEFFFDDHRRTGVGRIDGADAYVASLEALWQMSPDMATDTLYHVAVEEHGSLNVGRMFGTLADGGAFESIFVRLGWYEDGRNVGTELFELEDLDRARARFDERRRDPLRIPPNDATRIFDRWRQTFDARNWQALDALCAPGLVYEDRRRMDLISGDRDAFLANSRLLAELAPPRIERTVLATAGDRLVLEHLLWTSDDGEVENLQVVEVDAEGRFLALIGFDADARRAASTELFERYARSDAGRWTPPSVVEWVRAQNDHDLDRVRAVLPDDFVFHDRRRTGVGRLASANDFVASLAALFAQCSDAWMEMLHVLDAEKHAHLSVGKTSGTLLDGGDFESVYLRLLRFQDDRCIGAELFEVEDVDAARARFETLRPDPLRIPPNAASRAGERLRDCALAADWDALRDLCAPIVFEDRRPLFRMSGDCEMIVANTQAIDRSIWERSSRTLLATAGDRLALHHNRWRGGEAEGEFEVDGLEVSEVDAEGRLVAAVVFDPGDRRAAGIELIERYIASDPYAQRRALRLEMWRALFDHDLGRVGAALPDDFVYHDHRRVGAGRLEREEYIAWLSALFEQSPDALIEPLYVIAGESHAVLSVGHTFGTRIDGGAFESVFAQVWGPSSVELFELEDIDRARARFEELRPNPLRIPPNAATRVMDRLRDAREARDWDAMAALCSPSMLFDDRRRGTLLRGDREMFLASARVVASYDAQISSVLLATAGDRLALRRLHFGGSAGGGPVEAEALSLVEVDAEGRITAIVSFDPEDRRAASAELTERFARGPEAPPFVASSPHVMRALIERDIEPLRAALPEHFVVDDHRRAGMGRVEGAAAFIKSFRALYELSPDLVVESLYTVASGDRALLDMAHMFGTLATSGGEFESVYLRLFSFEGDRIAAMELFEPDDLDTARARFDALHADSRIAPNAASRLSARIAEAFASDGWQTALRALAGPSFRFEDRGKRALVDGDIEVWLRNLEVVRAWPGRRTRLELLETFGDRVALERIAFTGGADGGGYEGEFVRIVEAAASGLLQAVIHFDVDDRDIAVAEARARS